MRRVLIGAACLGIATLLVLQFVPLEFARDNPLATATIQAPPEVYRILRRSCFDCHSYETRWPWYAWVAPASWLVTADVAEARVKMNFSDWGTLGAGAQRRRVRKIVEEVEDGEMPMWQYTLLRPGARLSDSEIATLRKWRDGLDEGR